MSDRRAAPPSRRGSGGRLQWTESIRVRLTVLYSSVVFGLASIIVGLIYMGLSRSLSEEDIYQQGLYIQQRGNSVRVTPTLLVDEARQLEHLANEKALWLLRGYSLGALLVLFVWNRLVARGTIGDPGVGPRA